MRSARDRRGGYVTVLLAMLLFGLLAMAALVIDLGFARLTQRQLQSAADAAALEGLRGEGNASLAYQDRQAAAEQLIAWTFDDDLQRGNGDDGIVGAGGSFGAGPIVEFSEGAGEPGLHASQLMRVDVDNTTYKPAMQRRGLPAGAYRFGVAIQRGGVIAADYDLFTEGPSVPYLFARGSLISRQRIGKGINVGGVAIAEAQPVVRTWPALASVDGIQPVAYAVAHWGPSPEGAVSIISSLADGLSVGQPIVIDPTTPTITTGYCAIYDPTNMRVVGFGILGQTSSPMGIVASQNASARLSDAWGALAALSSVDRGDVLTANRALQHALKAPVLVRN